MTSWFWCLATDEDDPLDRFRVVRESLATARDLQQRDPRLLADLQEHSGLYETIWWFLVRAEKRRDRPMLNLIMSNVRGPGAVGLAGTPGGRPAVDRAAHRSDGPQLHRLELRR